MSCPTCSHTMSRLDGWRAICPRCGTMNLTFTDGHVEAAVPALVRWIRRAVPAILAGLVIQPGVLAKVKAHLHASGIFEACWTPEEREVIEHGIPETGAVDSPSRPG